MIKQIISSLPRSGSTYLLRSVYGLKLDTFTPHHLRHLKYHYPIKKFWEQYLYNDCKIIFLFRDPYHVVYSTYKQRMNTLHFQNCNLTNPYTINDLENEPEYIFDYDILNYEFIFDFWQAMPGVMCCRYEQIPIFHRDISLFLGKRVDWLEWQPHKYEIPEAIRKRIYRTYRRLIHKVSAAEKFKINEVKILG